LRDRRIYESGALSAGATQIDAVLGGRVTRLIKRRERARQGR